MGTFLKSFDSGKNQKNQICFRAESRDFSRFYGGKFCIRFQRLDRTFFPVDNGLSVGMVSSFRPVDAPL